GGCAAHTPHRLPGGGDWLSSSAGIATASAWPSASLATDRSSPASSANPAQRSRVPPEPGSGRSSRPDSTAARNAAAVDCQAAAPPRPAAAPPRPAAAPPRPPAAPPRPAAASGTARIAAEQVEDVVGVLLLLGEDVLHQPPGGHVGVAKPSDDLLVCGDHDPLGGEVLP